MELQQEIINVLSNDCQQYPIVNLLGSENYTTMFEHNERFSYHVFQSHTSPLLTSFTAPYSTILRKQLLYTYICILLDVDKYNISTMKLHQVFFC